MEISIMNKKKHCSFTFVKEQYLNIVKWLLASYSPI